MEISWNEAMIKAHEQLVKDNNTRELGKMRQHGNEHVIQEWLNNEFKVYRHEEMTEEQFGPLDHNCSGWDMLEPKSGLRIQTKYRGGKNESGRWHMEQTRRTSGTNKKKSHNGQVRYAEDEFDVIIFTSPEKIKSDFSSSDLISIPVEELKDPKKPGFLVGRVTPTIVKKWKKKDPMTVVKETRERLLRSKGLWHE